MGDAYVIATNGCFLEKLAICRRFAFFTVFDASADKIQLALVRCFSPHAHEDFASVWRKNEYQIVFFHIALTFRAFCIRLW